MNSHAPSNLYLGHILCVFSSVLGRSSNWGTHVGSSSLWTLLSSVLPVLSLQRQKPSHLGPFLMG